jgi:hypothetical protein
MNRLAAVPGTDVEADWPFEQLPSETVLAALTEPGRPELLINEWIASGDFRAIPVLLTTLSSDSDIPDLVAEARETQRINLEMEIDETRLQVEHDLVDGLIDDATHYRALIDSVRPTQVANFASLSVRLLSIRQALEIRREARLRELQERWQLRRDSYVKQGADAELLARFERFYQELVSHRDLRVIEEFLAPSTVADCREFVEHGSSAAGIRTLQEFLAMRSAIEELLLVDGSSIRRVQRDLSKSLKSLGFRYAEIQMAERKSIEDCLEAWVDLKRPGVGKRNSDPQHAHRIGLIMQRFLGFTLLPGFNSNDYLLGQDWLYLRVPMSDNGRARPIAQFGSRSDQKYGVLVLWERPSPETVSSIVKQTSSDQRPTVILYLGTLSDKQRKDLGRKLRADRHEVAIIDETLLIFLCTRTRRLEDFLRCSLPYSTLKPYLPHVQGGDIPTEIFYGREAMIQSLMDREGPCLVYGGRQLGKSALLRQVKRQFHQPQLRHYARVETIDTIGLSEPSSGLLRRLRSAFVDMGLLSSGTGHESEEYVVEEIKNAVLCDPDCRVLVLFDEADRFLEADSDPQSDFRYCRILRRLIQDTGRRFRPILAGLHAVTRFGQHQNHPLAQLGGKPIEVGPMEPAPARQLTVEPLGVLGFFFTDEREVLRILSYTNYHAGLIQIFCDALIQRARRDALTEPPYQIDQRHVEAVHMEVRSRIRERFEWTLAVDPRYQAIAWSMIYDQMFEGDSFSSKYGSQELRSLTNEHWPQGFEHVSIQEFRSLLEEMVVLGVLTRVEEESASDQYRLRSPNLVRLLGTDEEIYARLREIGRSEPPVKWQPNSFHCSYLKGDVRYYSPLTWSDEDSITRRDYGVAVLTGSTASGLDYVESRLNSMAGPERFTQFPPGIEPPYVDRLLRSFLQDAKRQPRLLVAHRHEKSDFVFESIATSIRFVRQHQRLGESPSLCVVHIIEPAAYWDWIQDAGIQSDVTGRLDGVIHLRRWDSTAIRQRLSDMDMVALDPQVKSLRGGTGGWFTLLEGKLRELAEGGSSDRASDAKIQTVEAECQEGFFGLLHRTPQAAVIELLRSYGEPLSRTEILSLCTDETALSSSQVDASIRWLSDLDLLVRDAEAQQGLERLVVEPVLARSWSDEQS